MDREIRENPQSAEIQTICCLEAFNAALEENNVNTIPECDICKRKRSESERSIEPQEERPSTSAEGDKNKKLQKLSEESIEPQEDRESPSTSAEGDRNEELGKFCCFKHYEIGGELANHQWKLSSITSLRREIGRCNECGEQWKPVEGCNNSKQEDPKRDIHQISTSGGGAGRPYGDPKLQMETEVRLKRVSGFPVAVMKQRSIQEEEYSQ